MKQYRVDPFELAGKLGITVVPALLPDGVSGKIERSENGSVAISYNTMDHPVRQRFTVAHELGHYIKGHLDGSNRLFRDTRENFSTRAHDWRETEANAVAAEILMPKSTIEELVYEKGITSPAELARLMDVSEIAMAYRLKNLGMVDDYEWL